MPYTLFDKIWNRHIVSDLGDGFSLLFVDRHMLNDMAGRGLLTLNNRNLRLRHPELTFAAADHTVATLWNASSDRDVMGNPYVDNLRQNASQHGFTLFDTSHPDFGIIHVVSAEQGLALPGSTVACGDSHTCTLGALGAIAWGLGQSDLVHILATQTSVQRKPGNMRITIDGQLADHVTPKDLILSLIARYGVAIGTGMAVEFAGSAIRAMSMDARFTICNMAVELGARFGIIAPDETTFAYLRDRPYAPAAEQFDRAVADWRTLFSDPEAAFVRELQFDAATVEPQISWGTNPSQTIGVSECIPFAPVDATETAVASYHAAIAYSGLLPGNPITGTPVDMVFIGSCTNSRLSDLRAAAQVVRGRKVASGVKAWVSPGSEKIRREAEDEGLASVFREAGFGWGHAGCSMCAGAGDEMREIGEHGARIVSTTNRNFIGRQGPGTRTHLASPPVAAATAIAGHICGAQALEAQK